MEYGVQHLPFETSRNATDDYDITCCNSSIAQRKRVPMLSVRFFFTKKKTQEIKYRYHYGGGIKLESKPLLRCIIRVQLANVAPPIVNKSKLTLLH